MSVERVDYYSDEEFQQALMQEEKECYDQQECMEDEERIARLDNEVHGVKVLLEWYSVEERLYVFSLYCMKCGHQHEACICNNRNVEINDLPF
jgi:hypothetical protein